MMIVRDITVIDTLDNSVVEVCKGARIPNRMQLNRKYRWVEDGRYKLVETVRRYDAFGVLVSG